MCYLNVLEFKLEIELFCNKQKAENVYNQNMYI